MPFKYEVIYEQVKYKDKLTCNHLNAMLGLDNMTHKDWEVGFRDNKKEEGMVSVKSWGTTTKNLFNPCSRSGFSALFIHLGRRKGRIYSRK